VCTVQYVELYSCEWLSVVTAIGSLQEDKLLYLSMTSDDRLLLSVSVDISQHHTRSILNPSLTTGQSGNHPKHLPTRSVCQHWLLKLPTSTKGLQSVSSLQIQVSLTLYRQVYKSREASVQHKTQRKQESSPSNEKMDGWLGHRGILITQTVGISCRWMDGWGFTAFLARKQRLYHAWNSLQFISKYVY